MALLAVHGKWITANSNIQLDPPDCQRLWLKGASVAFLFEQSWILSGSQQGRYAHVLTALMDRLASGEVIPMVEATLPLYTSLHQGYSMLAGAKGKVVFSIDTKQ